MQSSPQIITFITVSRNWRMLQFKADKEKSEDDRRWLRCELVDNGDAVFITLATKRMIGNAVRLGHGRALYMDATHGLQKYGL
jgi:hypothetical protein